MFDVNPDSIGHEKESITRSIAGCSRFFTLTQCGERPAQWPCCRGISAARRPHFSESDFLLSQALGFAFSPALYRAFINQLLDDLRW